MMRRISEFPALSLILLLLGWSSAAAIAVVLLFEKFHGCPTEEASLLPQKLTSKLQCAAACSRLPTCNAFQFEIRTGQCYHGDACSELKQWTDEDDCDSYKYTDVLCGDWDLPKPEFTKLKLKLFYKFSRSGLRNEVNPRQFCLKSRNVTIDSVGAHFGGHSDSFLRTETPGFWRFFKLGEKYSAFVRVQHLFNDSLNQNYHRFLSASGDFGNSFFSSDRRICDFGRVNEVSSELQRHCTSAFIPPSDGDQLVMSAGFTFSETAVQHFYFNGSIATVDSSERKSSAFSVDRFERLNLGLSSKDSKCLNGTMFCYGFSLGALSLDEFHQLELLFSND